MSADAPTETGPALVDEQTTTDEREVHFWFPITVEVIGAPDPDLSDRVVARVFDELNREMDSRA